MTFDPAPPPRPPDMGAGRRSDERRAARAWGIACAVLLVVIGGLTRTPSSFVRNVTIDALAIVLVSCGIAALIHLYRADHVSD